MNSTPAFQNVATRTLANGGDTFTAQGEQITSGFSVAGIAPAIRVSVDDLTAQDIADMVALFSGVQAFGTWIEDGEVWIEPTTVLHDADEADALARERDEIAYFDLDTLTEIRLR